jgi:hypothetical protein
VYKVLSMQEGSDSRITTASRVGQRCDTIGIGCLAGDDNMPPHRQERCGRPESLQGRPRCEPASHRAGESRWPSATGSFFVNTQDCHETATTSIIVQEHCSRACLDCLFLSLYIIRCTRTHAIQQQHRYTATANTPKRLSYHHTRQELAGACTLPVPIGGSARHTNLRLRTATYRNIRQRTFASYTAPPPHTPMDSMRHLSSSLPGTRRRNEQPHQLLSDFKAAALSVTNLYKTATAENARSRDAGYQDALDDLLAFLDKENLGLMDGEGWRVRRWATERLDDAPKGTEDEEDASKEEAVETRSSSPEVQRKPIIPMASSSLVEEDQQRRASEPPQHATQYQPQPQLQPTNPHAASPAPATAPILEDFSFRSAQAYPTNHNRDDNTTMDVDPASTSTSTSTNSVRTAPKPSSKTRHTNHARSRDNTRSSSGPTFNFNLGSGAGGKRKMPYPDFFDISGLNPEGGNDNSRRDGGGRGGKKGRHV